MVFAVLLGAWSSALFASYDVSTAAIRLPVLGWTVGPEAEKDHADGTKKRRRKHEGRHRGGDEDHEGND